MYKLGARGLGVFAAFCGVEIVAKLGTKSAKKTTGLCTAGERKPLNSHSGCFAFSLPRHTGYPYIFH